KDLFPVLRVGEKHAAELVIARQIDVARSGNRGHPRAGVTEGELIRTPDCCDELRIAERANVLVEERVTTVLELVLGALDEKAGLQLDRDLAEVGVIGKIRACASYTKRGSAAVVDPNGGRTRDRERGGV